MWRTHWFWRRFVTTKQERCADHAPYTVSSFHPQNTVVVIQGRQVQRNRPRWILAGASAATYEGFRKHSGA